MILARVVGTVVSTAKNPGLTGKTFLLCRSIEIVEKKGAWEEGSSQPFIAVDLVGAPEGSVVMITTGTAAKEMSGAAVDAAVAGIVDCAVIHGRRIATEL